MDLLQEAGFSIIVAPDAELGIQLAQESHPNLILMDLHLPGKDGFEATRILKSDTQMQDIPIIAYTALAMREDKEKAMAYGCDGVICKPIDIDSFADTVESYIFQCKISTPIKSEIHETSDPQRKEIGQLIHDITTHMAGEGIALQVLLMEKLGPLTPQQREFVKEILDSNQDVFKMMENWVRNYFSN